MLTNTSTNDDDANIVEVGRGRRVHDEQNDTKRTISGALLSPPVIKSSCSSSSFAETAGSINFASSGIELETLSYRWNLSASTSEAVYFPASNIYAVFRSRETGPTFILGSHILQKSMNEEIVDILDLVADKAYRFCEDKLRKFWEFVKQIHPNNTPELARISSSRSVVAGAIEVTCSPDISHPVLYFWDSFQYEDDYL
ncbi:hypothetical protein MBLNU457_g1134t1 [Dothideomycetes sp. NU457]